MSIMLLSFSGQTGRSKSVDLASGFWADTPRVLPLGDSNTLGKSNVLSEANYEGYRRALWSHATEDQFFFDYVGSRSNGTARLPDRSHEGVSGIRATTVVGQATRHATTHRPDVVLLMLGTNDALNEANAADTVPNELLSIMRSFDAIQPNVTILLAPLPPIDPDAAGYTKRADADEIRAAVNAQLPALAAQAQGQGIDARFVPMQNLGTGDLFDGIHPTQAGYAKIAAAFYGAMQDGLAAGDFGGARSSTAGVKDITGSEAADYLRGDAQANRIIGRGGADRIEGGAAADVLTGSGSADVFVWRTPAEGGDRITDFGSADFLEFSAAGFGGGLVPDGTAILRGAGTPRPQGSAGQFLYDRDDGRLYWDVDGTGPAGRELIVTLSGAPALSASDILIL
jgi:lysophospholipase L1-like esterase